MNKDRVSVDKCSGDDCPCKSLRRKETDIISLPAHLQPRVMMLSEVMSIRLPEWKV